MTSKRTIENSLEDLSDDVLEGLPPESRLRLLMEARTDGRESHTDRLIETCRGFAASDFQKKYTVSHFIALLAVYELKETHRRLLAAEDVLRSVNSLLRAQSDDPVDAPGEMDEDLYEAWTELEEAAAQKHVDLHNFYEALRRFAEDDVGTSLETFLGVHHDGEAVLDDVRAALDDREHLIVEGVLDKEALIEEPTDQLHSELSAAWGEA
jgi:hypothetical protein